MVKWILVTVLVVLLGLSYLIRQPNRLNDIEQAKKAWDLVGNAKRVLLLGAHPDDAEWYAAGTLVKFLRAGATVTVVVATNGEKGRGSHVDLGKLRQSEQQRAAQLAGYTRLEMWGLPDRGLSAQEDLEDRVRQIWLETQPEVVLSFDSQYPALPYIHPDHQAIGWAVYRVWESLGDTPGNRPVLMLFHSRRPNALVDISDTIEVKLAAIAAHESQGFQRSAQSMLGRRNAATGKAAGMAFAESFRLVTGGVALETK
ncbi:MAG: PIG-L deacetylase family protein [Bacillota bacterium]